MNVPTIADLKAIQRRLDLLDEHVVWIGPTWFVIAHTDTERATMDLEDCDLHAWLHGLDGPPCERGYYTAVPHEWDAYSEPYPVDRWDFHPLDIDFPQGSS